MKQRIITGVVLALVIIPTIVLGGWPFRIVVTLIGLGAAYELLHITHDPRARRYLYIIMAAYILTAIFYPKTLLGSQSLMVIFMVVLMTCGLFDESMPMTRMAYYFMSGVLVGNGIHLVYLLRMEYGFQYILFLAAATLLADTGAYFVGVKFGHTPLNPRLSPKKTIEGSIGGIVVGGLSAVIFGLVFPMNIKVIYMILAAFILSTTGQIGDLTFSSFKRAFEIKDYSQIFPGHGGVLDRFDSIIFNAMVFGLLLQIMIK